MDGESNAEDGTIRIENGRRIQRVTLKKNTLGILLGIHKRHTDVAFERGENRTIRFAYSSTHDNFRFTVRRISYEGKDFIAQFGAKPRILVVKKSLSKTSKESRKIKGMRIGE